jgi:hypothetical protein
VKVAGARQAAGIGLFQAVWNEKRLPQSEWRLARLWHNTVE